MIQKVSVVEDQGQHKEYLCRLAVAQDSVSLYKTTSFHYKSSWTCSEYSSTQFCVPLRGSRAYHSGSEFSEELENLYGISINFHLRSLEAGGLAQLRKEFKPYSLDFLIFFIFKVVL